MKNGKIIIAAGALALVAGLLLSGRPEKAPRPTLQQSLDRQAAADTLYQPADIARWQDALFHRLQPEIVILGSSQVLAFGAENFNRPSMNIGGMATLPDAIFATRPLFTLPSTKTLLIALDPRWLVSAFSTKECVSIFCKPAQTDGYDKNGAYHPVALWTGKNPSVADSHFSKSINTSTVAKQPNPWLPLGFAIWLDKLRERHIHTIVFIPPTSSKTADDADFSALAAAAESHGAVFYDERHSIPRLDDCEFSSGYEPGQILAKRLLLDMATRDSDLQAVVRLPEIGWDIDHFAGRVSKLPDETDFLDLGCSKVIKPLQ